jgi:hypothetical protein
MDFLKKHYEKALLGAVLFGLVVGAAFLPLMIIGERRILEDKSNVMLGRQPKPLPPLNLSRQEELINRAETPVSLDLSRTNRLFNPMRWQQTADGHLVKVPSEGPATLCQVTNITPLYFIITLDRVESSDSGSRYAIGLTHQATRRKMGPFFASKGDRKEYTFPGEKKEWFTLSQVEGPPENPRLSLQLSDLTTVSIATNAPFKRVEGYTADLYYPPDKKYFPYAHRKGDSLSVAGEDYIIVDIKQDVVVLSAKSNGKMTPIQYSPGP